MSSSDIAVSVRDLSKSYTIVHEDQKHTTAVEALTHSLKNIGKKQVKETFWALKDVSFDIAKGDVVGIIGRNGAGKSTLLKILSRITEPTSGQIDLYGRVGSLLEVGTGFHPELTGRENTYLNGAILGMSKREIASHFDAIVDFAGVEKFLDTPVKRYSSGMYVRLAFAVAAHLEPEILIVDEVLAVGDAEFQKKCLGKMQDVAAHGRTVLFVSHNMTAVQSLCTHGIFLQNGSIVYAGSSSEAISHYLETAHIKKLQQKVGVFDHKGHKNKYMPNSCIIRKVTLENDAGKAISSLPMGDALHLAVDVEKLSDFQGADVGIFIKSETGQALAHFTTGMKRPHAGRRADSEQVRFCFATLPFIQGDLWIDVYVAQEGIRYLDFVEDAANITIVEHNFYGSGYQLKPEYGFAYLDGSCQIVENLETSIIFPTHNAL